MMLTVKAVLFTHDQDPIKKKNLARDQDSDITLAPKTQKTAVTVNSVPQVVPVTLIQSDNIIYIQLDDDDDGEGDKKR